MTNIILPYRPVAGRAIGAGLFFKDVMTHLIEFLLNIKRAYRLYFQQKERDSLLDEIAVKFHRYDLTAGVVRSSDPTRDIGTALKLAEFYGVKLHIGMSYGDCRAVLPERVWTFPLDPMVSKFDYGCFTSTEEVKAIYAFGFTAQEAICKCLINAKIAGVI